MSRRKQDWDSSNWVKLDGTTIPISRMTLVEILQAIWALHLLAVNSPRYSYIFRSNLWDELMERMRDILTELELSND